MSRKLSSASERILTVLCGTVWMVCMAIKARGPSQVVAKLSGGTQQKIPLTRSVTQLVDYNRSNDDHAENDILHGIAQV
jgi:ABC-type hemin transport system ATPase subunit